MGGNKGQLELCSRVNFIHKEKVMYVRMSFQVVDKSSLDLAWLIEKEVRIMSVLDHPHIVHLNEVYEEKSSVCFVMELAKGK